MLILLVRISEFNSIFKCYEETAKNDIFKEEQQAGPLEIAKK